MAELILLHDHRSEAVQQWARSVRRRAMELREEAEADRRRAAAIRAERRLGAPDGQTPLRRQLQAAESHAMNLEKALISNRRIGMAVGILMASQGLTEEQAFAVLRDASSHRNTKLSGIAEELIYTGTLVTPRRQASSRVRPVTREHEAIATHGRAGGHA